jgi:hypothetical protein
MKCHLYGTPFVLTFKEVTVAAEVFMGKDHESDVTITFVYFYGKKNLFKISSFK